MFQFIKTGRPQRECTVTARNVRPVGLLGTAIGVLLGLGCANVHAEAVYKYEERGLVVYQDRAPDSKQDNGHSILNNQGVVLQQVLSRNDRREARKVERQLELSRIRDRALLATFTTEEDLVRTRDDRVGMIDGLISRLDDRIRILSERLAVVGKRIQMQEQANDKGKAQDSLYTEQRSIQRNIENAWSLIDSKAAERSEVADKFDDDLIRYRELKAERS
ncbi:hypothetical protein [Granulosicoccus antarcticus]|uniref:DUF4124 domain-containing protein n=1 Tax=Granulosicoccus antarcticus IMCC3135 TaxID=1192854 RepID=A0A2Z2P576_9GAMM|nr:hypothetical protein [Granulosicoccus antarcticus]ASJ76640.1 hypothetical protein IMCC3135_32980 [Granulosicoccus antarcticus IMCC3135]